VSRLPPSSTERIDRSRPLSFSFAGRPLEGFAGDTVASALWAAGVRTFSRSFEYHRPRGLYDLEGEGSSQLVAIDGVPNRSAGTVLLRDGMRVAAQNLMGLGGVPRGGASGADPGRDRFGFLDRLGRFMPAGFYYRMFHRPAAAWPFFAEQMRAMAGLGVLDVDTPLDGGRRAELHLNADVAVLGGGPAGMTAALAAAEHVDRVCLFEARPRLGGHLDWRVRPVDGVALHERARELAEQVEGHPRVRVFTSAPVTGVWGELLVTGFQVGGEDDGYDERHWECRARALVVATGAFERPLVFQDNDRPGVMQADTAWRLARTWGVRPGARAVFSTADDLALEAALDLADLGVRVAAIADARTEGHDPALVDALADRGIETLAGWAASRALGRRRISGVWIAPLPADVTESTNRNVSDGSGQSRTGVRLDCDLLVASAGRQPELGALTSAGARLAYSTHRHAFEPVELPPGVSAAGSLLGLVDVESIEASGRVAGLEAAVACGAPAGSLSADLSEARAHAGALPGRARGVPHVRGPDLGAGDRAFIDYDEDGTWKNAVQCAAQGFDVPELAKRFGNFGLGPGQYRVPGQNLAMAMAEIAGTPLADIRGTTVRPPFVPPAIATLAGPGHDVHKRTPLHDEQAARGATFRRAGAWARARYFSDDPLCAEEIRAVRTSVGLLDSSPLGKFRLFGPDALRALQRVYISDMSKAKPWRAKYSAMCNDTGNIVDDGVVVRVGEDDFYLTTSSNRAGSTVEWFRYHTRYDGWDYNLVNLTDALASINVAGPNARAVVSAITDADLSNEAFPYMGVRDIEVGDGVVARCLRLGFVGELSYELHVPASTAGYVHDLLEAAGEPFGIRPFGLEAQNAMRAEKGHVIIGTESEQRVTLLDIGMGWMWDREDTASKKVGAPALRACADQPGRLKLVGLRVDDAPGEDSTGRSMGATAEIADGTLVVDGDAIAGYVCTTRRSETLGFRFALALVRDDLAVEDGRVELYQDEGRGALRRDATVTAPHFYDPAGDRLRA